MKTIFIAHDFVRDFKTQQHNLNNRGEMFPQRSPEKIG